MKNNAIGNEIAQQIFDIAEPGRTFDKRIYDLLCFCYEIVPEDENLGIICGYLIKGQQYDPVYHIWFEKGIEKNEEFRCAAGGTDSEILSGAASLYAKKAAGFPAAFGLWKGPGR